MLPLGDPGTDNSLVDFEVLRGLMRPPKLVISKIPKMGISLHDPFQSPSTWSLRWWHGDLLMLPASLPYKSKPVVDLQPVLVIVKERCRTVGGKAWVGKSANQDQVTSNGSEVG